MTRTGFAVVLIVLAVLEGLIGQTNLVSASHDDFRFKWPYSPETGFQVTTYPYSGVHSCGGGGSCTDAWDIVIDDGDIKASAEGTIDSVVSNIAANTCNPADGGGYGNNLSIRTSTPTGDVVVKYGHFASIAGGLGNPIYQGDSLGAQGHTGHTEGNTPYPCGTHLHFQFNPSHPASIDGSANPSDGTNSTAGKHTSTIATLPSNAIRDVYKYLGIPFGSSWATVGWTADWTGSQSGCDSGTYCQLYVHYSPNTLLGHWGLTQTFRLHPGTQTFDDGAIMVGRWTWNGGSDPSPNPYWVKPGFFFTWLFNKQGPPLDSDVSAPHAYCSTSHSCAAYQRFALGYVWKNSSGVWASVPCADYSGYSNNGGYSNKVLVDDILAATNAYFQDDPGPQYGPWPESRLDAYGDGFMRISEIMAAVNTYGDNCYP
jgi:hypothetical protein